MNQSDYRQWLPKLTPLECPFCGEAPRIMPSNPEKDGDAWGSVRCVNKRCHAQPTVDDESQIADMRGPGAYKDMAIKKWNKRPPKEPKE